MLFCGVKQQKMPALHHSEDEIIASACADLHVLTQKAVGMAEFPTIGSGQIGYQIWLLSETPFSECAATTSLNGLNTLPPCL